jgi:DNA-binding CsgD family transcriptional regulator
MARELLTDLELEVLTSIAKGVSQEKICEEKDLKPTQIRTMLDNIRRKYGARTVQAAIAQAYELGDIQRGTVPLSTGKPRAVSVNIVDSERQALALLKEGKSADEIAVVMKVGVQTIHTYWYRARQKLGAKTNQEAIELLFNE